MIDRIASVTALLAGVATLVIAALITFDVLMRYFLDAPQLFVDELASFLQVFVIFAGLAYTYRTGTHVRVDLVTGPLPGPVRAYLRVITLSLGVVLLGVIFWVTLQSALAAWRIGRVSAVMLYPLWPTMLLIPAGTALMLVAMLGTLVRQIRVLGAPAERRDEVSPVDDRA